MQLNEENNVVLHADFTPDPDNEYDGPAQSGVISANGGWGEGNPIETNGKNAGHVELRPIISQWLKNTFPWASEWQFEKGDSESPGNLIASHAGKKIRFHAEWVFESDFQDFRKLLHEAKSAKTKTKYPLHTAAKKGDIPTMRKLIQNGENVNLRNTKGYTPIIWALTRTMGETTPVDTRHVEVVTLLVNAGADVNGRMSMGSTPLHYAALQHCVPLIKRLIELGADVNATDEYHRGHYPLDWSVTWKKDMATYELLKSYGAKHSQSWLDTQNAVNQSRQLDSTDLEADKASGGS